MSDVDKPAPPPSPRRGEASLTGALTLATLPASAKAVKALEGKDSIDLSDVTELDTAGAWLIAQARQRAAAGGRPIQLTGMTEGQALLIETVEQAMPKPERKRRQIPGRPGDGLENMGKTVAAKAKTAFNAVGFFGVVVAHLLSLIIHPTRLRVTALVYHMQDAGLNAVPIVSLMGFLIGIVLAFQGATQLQQFGAEVYVVDLVAISILRELGILLTAIIVAGRSASAFTAAIGSMKMREEIDAMRVLGLDPIDRLVVPRVLALVFLLPVLGFIACMTGLMGGMLMAWIELNITPGMFQTRLLEGTDPVHAIIGLVKAPFFAVIIAVIGCHQGMQVEGNAESLGQHTSRSVVQAIFLVIVTDALFSIFFAIWGI